MSEEEPLLAEDSGRSTEEDSEIGLGSIPYSRIQSQCLPFEDPTLKRLVPGCGITVSIQDAYYKDRKCWYTLDLQHGCFKWTLKKRFHDFLYLHQKLQVYRTLLALQFPEIKREKDRRRPSVVMRNSKVPKVPIFPLTTDIVKRRRDFTWRKAALESYVQSILDVSHFRNLPETLEFLEIGPLSFVEELGSKSKEGFVSRRCHRRDNPFGHLGRFCGLHVCPFWKKRWLFIKENFVGLLDPRSGHIDSILLFDRNFRVDTRKRRTQRDSGILIQNLSRKLFLKCENERQAESWALEFHLMLDRGSKDFVRANRYDSFAPVRPFSECRWIVDGATYFEAVADVLDKAKEEIYIADWWLTPEIYLKRPTIHGHYWQLDYVLKRKAREGVQIYVLLYKELEVALGINSYHTKKKLKRMHKNIKVIRHPEVSKGVLLWAHHEKLVCVDQTYAFVGGLDLCYGRWDDYQHRLSDFGELEKKLRVLRHTSIPRKDSAPLQEARSTSSLPELSSEAEMTKVEQAQPESPETGYFRSAVRKYQATRTFKDIKKRLSMEAVMDESHPGAEKLVSALQPSDRRRTIQEMALLVLGMDRKFQLWHGKDYANFIFKDLYNLHQPYSDNIDRNITPRMPWHDVGLFVQGKIARDIARHFILRWNHAKAEVCPRDSSYRYLMPKAYANFGDNVPSILDDTIGTIFRAECQVLRSLSHWSGGISETERSIQEAYIGIIQGSKHFIYIENQFFVTQPSGEHNIFNGIADALYNRIIKAHRNKVQFHVYVVLPLLPAFEGELGTGTGTCIQAVSYWIYKSICRGPTSLYDRLSRHIQDPSLYISFCGLRTHGLLNYKLVTELVYVHSKLLIADDQVAIIGSANINDRSLLGRRDSEIAVVIRDTHFLEKEEGRPHEAGKFCYSLRNAIFREHLGLMTSSQFNVELRDPSSQKFSKDIWTKTAISNTEIYEEVFHCIPTDSAHTFRELKVLQSMPSFASTNPEEAMKKLKEIRGYLVLFPFFFLCDEKLALTLSTKERYLPVSVWT
ncbi:phospholipase D1-like [Argiope bruennichi]|uniref:phospholipase D1-like n=1 Tax=Argiope bruennichi TaxID=94029 RepID=UPI00249465D4|nr:phospholipase D1-like [Argiope bruennichi]